MTSSSRRRVIAELEGDLGMSRADAMERTIQSGMGFALWSHAMAYSGAAPALGEYGFDPDLDDRRGAMKAADQAARDLTGLIREANHLGPRPLSELCARAGLGSTSHVRGEFGEALANACLGAPVEGRWLDGLTWNVPSFSIEFDGEDLVWEGSVDDLTANPALSAQVLLLEDDPALQKSTSRMLKKIFGNPTIYVADNVTSAIGMLEVHDIKLIVSDVDVLGPRSGIDLFHWVKEHRPELVDRYIFFTGNMAAQDEHYRVLMNPAGVEDFRAALHAPAPTATQAPAPSRVPARVLAKRRTTAPPYVPPPAPVPSRTGSVTLSPSELAQMSDEILEAYLTASGGEYSTRVRLADLRNMMRATARPRLDAALRDLARRQAIALFPIDDRHDLTKLDQDAALDLSGVPQHILWIEAPRAAHAPAPVQHRPPDTATVAQVVREVLPTIKSEAGPSGRPRSRFGPEKVFIQAIWRRVHDDPRLGGMSRPEFDRALIDANRQRLIDLARADLVAAMDPDEVDQSEIQHMGSTFHFVRDPEGKW